MPEAATEPLFAVVIAAPHDDDRVVAGVALGERGRRSAMYGGVDASRVFVVRDDGDLARARAAVVGPAVVVDVTAQVVMPALVEKLVAAGGPCVAVDAAGAYAGALRVGAAELPALWRALGADLAGGDDAVAAKLRAEAPALDVGALGRHPARAADLRAATRWLFQFAYKPELDSAIVRHVYRPLSAPFTRLFVKLPFTPNHITIAAILVAQLGCVVAARPGYLAHVAGIFLIAFVSGILDAVDGEVARVRLQRSKIGAWLDAMGDDVLRVSLILAIGAHVAPSYPDLPIWWITIASAVLTVAAMAPMWWYCITVLHSPNIQTYRAVMSDSDGGSSLSDRLGKLGAEVAGRDFIDLATFALAVAGLPVIAVFGLAAGGVVAFALVIPMHLKALRLRRRSAA
ncbi:MAG: CDP-alcohol phosphatidyltransferase family protein [Deltaproteobacteria bacterium]|nr:CDP-alcohol phosphatidyltransferase family protein [Deltaproteobacteria bacterium]